MNWSEEWPGLSKVELIKATTDTFVTTSMVDPAQYDHVVGAVGSGQWANNNENILEQLGKDSAGMYDVEFC
jgi:hypothetical protein